MCLALEDSSAGDSSSAAEASDELDRISDRFQPVAASTNKLSTLFISLVVWVAVITLVLAVVVTVTCRRRRSHAADLNIDSSDSISTCSVQLTH